MTENVLFSIIIPCFNAERFIERCLKSITEQTFGSYEIIIVDGQSTDRTLARVRTFDISNLLIISEKDKGVYDAMNKGVALSKGEYIYIMGSDDTLAHKTVLQDVASLASTCPGIIFGSVQNIAIDHPLVPKVQHNKWTNLIRFKNTLHQQGCFYSREWLIKYPFDASLKVLADYDLHLTLFCNEQVSSVTYDNTIAICEARGLSKQFNYSLYKEELKIKRKHFRGLEFAVQFVWVHLKYVIKKITR